MTKFLRLFAVVSLAVPALASSGCSRSGGGDGAGGGGDDNGTVKIDGSSTVYPISQAVAEEFQRKSGGRVTVGVSGTGGGFKKFCRGEIDIANASRPIKDTEVAQCKEGGVEFIEVPVAYDGIAVVVHPENDWVTSMTVAELKQTFAPEAQGKITKWSQIRPGWPDQDIHLFGPGVDSGTYDYFTQAIVGTEHASRGDFTSSEDDNVLVQGVSTDTKALGFFGVAYYAENKDRLKLVPIDDGDDTNGAGPIAPTGETIANGTYQPLARPIFMYVSKKSAARPEIDGFIRFLLGESSNLVKEVGYIPLPPKAYELTLKRYTDRTTGSVFHGSQVGVSVEQLLGAP